MFKVEKALFPHRWIFNMENFLNQCSARQNLSLNRLTLYRCINIWRLYEHIKRIRTWYLRVCYLTPMVHCRKVHTPHIKRKVDMISAVTSSRSPAQMYVLTMIGMEMVELMLRSTCWTKQAQRSQLMAERSLHKYDICVCGSIRHMQFSVPVSHTESWGGGAGCRPRDTPAAVQSHWHPHSPL